MALSVQNPFETMSIRQPELLFYKFLNLRKCLDGSMAFCHFCCEQGGLEKTPCAIDFATILWLSLHKTEEYYLIFLGSPQYDISETISSAQMECVKGKMEVSDSQRPC